MGLSYELKAYIKDLAAKRFGGTKGDYSYDNRVIVNKTTSQTWRVEGDTVRTMRIVAQ